MVLIGRLLIGNDKNRTGKLIITLGAGLGLIGLIFSIIVAIMKNNITIGSFFSVGLLVLRLSIFARLMIKKRLIFYIISMFNFFNRKLFQEDLSLKI